MSHYMHSTTIHTPVSPPSPAELPGEEIDYLRLLSMVGGDLPCLSEIVDCYLEDLGPRIIELAAAITGRQRELTGRIAHLLRGSTSNFSVGATFAACTALESAAQTATWEEIASAQEHLMRTLRGLLTSLTAVRRKCALGIAGDCVAAPRF